MTEGPQRDTAPPAAVPVRAALPRWGAVLAGLGLTGVVAGALWVFLPILGRPSAATTGARRAAAANPDPRLLYKGPFRNIHPDVRYVGDAECAACHFDISESFAHHPMGRSLIPIARVTDEQFDAAHHNPFLAAGSRFFVERRDGKVWHRQTRVNDAGRTLYTIEHEVHYAIGSGLHGHSYLTNQGGFLFQTPISWYAQKQTWDRSPAFKVEQVRRPIGGDCLFCHANRAHFRESSVNRYDSPLFDGHAIGCERCHGPGELHVRSTRAEDIVDPRKLEPVLRDAVCEQCHLEGEARVVRRGRGLYDFRPGLPLEQFWAVVVSDRAPGEDRRAVTHVEQMHESRCFQGSSGKGKLGCVSCHDPHVHPDPAERVAFYRKRCLDCHENEHKGCSLPAAQRLRLRPDDSCIACHMPPFGTEDIAHTASTDHSVPRRPHPRPAGNSPNAAPRQPVAFHPRLAEDKSFGRDLGIALTVLAQDLDLPPESGPGFLRVLALLERAVADDPDDLPAWEAKGMTLLFLNRPAEALAAFQTVLDRDPQKEKSLVGAARAAGDAGRLDESHAYWRRAIDANPYLAAYRGALTDVLLRLGAWAEAGKECRSWLDLEPSSIEARKARIACLLHEGRKEEAAREFAVIEALRPPDLPRIRDWFQACSTAKVE
jgi:tetratricopeptide (TPR) repeat protein